MKFEKRKSEPILPATPARFVVVAPVVPTPSESDGIESLANAEQDGQPQLDVVERK